MLFPAIYFLISIIGLGIASYTDHKTRMVYNKLTLPMTALGLVLHAAETILYVDLMPIMLSIIGGAFGFIFAYVFYKLGVWAGGDVKLLMAIGTLNPLAPVLLSFLGLYAGQISIPIFPLTFTLYSILSVFPYILGISLIGILRDAKLRKKVIETRGLVYSFLMAGLVILMFNLVMAVDGTFITFLISMVLLMILSFAIVRIKNNFALVVAGLLALFIAHFIGQGPEVVFDFIYTLAVFILIDLIINIVKITRSDVLKYYKKITNLEEGEIAAELIYIDTKGKVIVYDKSFREKAFEIATGKMSPVKTVLADPKVAAGLEPEQIKTLKALVKQKKLKNRIRVKKSTAFAPVFLIGYIIAALIGDMIWLLV